MEPSCAPVSFAILALLQLLSRDQALSMRWRWKMWMRRSARDELSTISRAGAMMAQSRRDSEPDVWLPLRVQTVSDGDRKVRCWGEGNARDVVEFKKLRS